MARSDGALVSRPQAALCYEEAVRRGHAAAGYNLALLVAGGRLRAGHDVTGLLERAAAAGSSQAASFLQSWHHHHKHQKLSDGG